MSAFTDLSPDKVIPAVRRHMIGDGFEFVVDLEASHGSFVVDKLTGREMIDFYSCFASSPLGFNHPKVVGDDRTLKRLQLAAINNVTNSDLFTEFKAEFVEAFYKYACPEYLTHLFLIAGGSLGIENALKAAFDWKAQLNHQRGETRTANLKVLHLKEAFHGRSGYTLSLTNTDPVKTDLFPKFDWPRINNPKIVFPDTGAAREDLLKREKLALKQAKHYIYQDGHSIAACIIEPIQGEGGDNHFRPEFARALQDLCNENDILFIVDEVQTGVGLTGKMWGFEHLNLKPDMLCFGKKTQVCGFVASDKIDNIENNVFRISSRINSTWGGNLVDMVRAQRYLEIIAEDDLVTNAAQMGVRLLDGLHLLQSKFDGLISNARGKGLMCAFDVRTKELRDNLRRDLFKAGMLVLGCGERSIRFRPAININEDEIGRGLEILEQCLNDLG